MRTRLVIPSVLALAVVTAACEKKEKSSGDDTNPPEVAATLPSNGGMASISVTIHATFDEAMDPATITANTFRLSSGGNLVPGTVGYAGETATFTPTSSLAGGATYTAQILDEVTDEAGNAMEAAYSWSFTTSSGEFALSSTAFAGGSPIPQLYTCDGSDFSPALAWTAGPPGTLSYAILFTDLDNGVHHWGLWDIPPSETSLPELIPTGMFPNPPGGGAKQNRSYDGTTYGYLGPCPGEEHTYRFTVYAVDIATLPNVTNTSTGNAVRTELELHDLASASLSGTYDPP